MSFVREFLRRVTGNDLELISVHVPKTAGTSFLKVLEHVYGRGLKTVYTKAEGNPDIWGGRAPAFPFRCRAIHGHFPATPALLARYPSARLVAWVRDPVRRMISYYDYWRREKRHGNPNHEYFLDRDLSLIELAKADFMRNEMSGYLDRVPLDAFDFIGVTEHFEEDLRAMAELLGWELSGLPRANASRTRTEITDEEREELQEILAEEIAFYRRIVERRHAGA